MSLKIHVWRFIQRGTSLSVLVYVMCLYVRVYVRVYVMRSSASQPHIIYLLQSRAYSTGSHAIFHVYFCQMV